MDFKWKWYDLGWLKYALNVCGALLIVAAGGLGFVTVVVKAGEQRSSIDTYYAQAVQAATPSQFSTALRQLDKALDNAGMVSGNTAVIMSGPDNDMAFKRARFLSLADRAEVLIELPIASTEVAVGLADIRIALQKINLSAYSFWVFQQGGIWPAFYIPVILMVLAVVGFIVSDALPYSFGRHVRVVTTPA